LPATITSVARLMPSTSDSRQPYRLSNLLFVTESLTLIAGKPEPAFAVHLVEPLDAGRRLLGDAANAALDRRIEVRTSVEPRGDRRKQRLLLVARWMRDDRAILFRLRTEMDEQRCVAAVVEDHVRRKSPRPFEDAMREFQ
jgi:hypothetical protein